MGFAYFDFKEKRYWLGAGNVRTCRDIDENEKMSRADRDTRLGNFLARNAVSITTPVESVFMHPFEQRFPAEQRPGFVDVPETEGDVEAAAKAAVATEAQTEPEPQPDPDVAQTLGLKVK